MIAHLFFLFLHFLYFDCYPTLAFVAFFAKKQIDRSMFRFEQKFRLSELVAIFFVYIYHFRRDIVEYYECH